jgi:hypothetical protein
VPPAVLLLPGQLHALHLAALGLACRVATATKPSSAVQRCRKCHTPTAVAILSKNGFACASGSL